MAMSKHDEHMDRDELPRSSWVAAGVVDVALVPGD
jgi:hypothetical protein